MTRTQRALQNSFWGLISKFSYLLLGFVSRTIFIRCLGETYLGVNGVYTELLKMLSLAELGFGTALNFAMYKPVADNDEEKIKKLLNFYKTTYRIIAIAVTVIGAILIPFLPKILKGTDSMSAFDLRLYFVIFLANTVINYFVSYKFSYLNALQKNYISTNIDTVVHFVTVIAQIVVMLLTKSFLAYLLIQSGLMVGSRLIISIFLNKKYPIVKGDSEYKLTKEERKPIFKEVKGLMVHQFANVAVHSTDNIIIGSLSGLGVVMVGLISNYNLIITGVGGFVALLFTSLTSGFGNLVASSTVEHYERAFRETNFLNAWIYGFCSIAFFVLIPPFIELWLGKEFLIDNVSFLLIVINNYMLGQSTIYNNARVAKGEFKKDQWSSLMQALVNLVVSIIAAKYLGLMGVYIGTVVSRLTTTILRPFLTYKFLYNKSSAVYYKWYAIYFLAVAVLGALTYYLCSFILVQVTIWRFALAMVVVGIVPNLLFPLIFCRTREWKDLYNRGKAFIRGLKKKGEKNEQ